MTLGLAVVMVARLGASADPSYGGHKLQLFLGNNVAFLVAGILIARTRRETTIWSCLTLGTVALGAFVLLQNLVRGGAQDVLPGRLGLYSEANPIALARGASTGLLLAVFLLLAAPVAWRRIAALALIPVLGVSFIGAGSRGPVVGLVAGLFVLLALSVGDRASRRRLALLAVALVVSIAIVPQLVPGQNVSRSLSVLVGGGEDAGGGDVSNGRYQIWSETWSIFADHPWTGIGTGSFAERHPVEIYPHNIFLEAAAELGFAGLLLVLGIVALGFTYALRAWRHSAGEDRQHAALVTAFLTAAVVNSQFSGDLALNSGVWLGAGLAFGLVQRIVPTSPGQEPLRRLRTRWRKRGEGVPELLEPSRGPRQFTPAPPRGAGAGGEITSPLSGSFVCGEVVVTCRPGGAGWTIGSVTIECAQEDGSWVAIGEAAAEQDFEVFVLMPAGGRRQVAVLRSGQRAEEMRLALAGEHGVTPEQIEIRPAKRGRWGGRDAREFTWDTRGLEDGECLLRAVTTDVTGRRAPGPEIRLVIDNEAPSVRLDKPPQGAVLMGVVDVEANAKDERSGLALVRFETSPGGDEWTEVASFKAAPFKASWNTGLLGEGDYQLRAIALDKAGNEAVSKAVTVRVERVVAAVRLEDPGECMSRTVRLRASVRDETKIASVEFQVAAAGTFAWQPLGISSQPPFELDFDSAGVEDGVYDLRAVARDRRGGIDASRILRGLRVDNVAPTVVLLEPAAGALLRGEAALSARASDAGSGVSSAVFQFSGDGATWRPVVTSGESAGAAYWDTSRVEDGDYQLRAVVADGAGNLATSDPIAVRIDNTPPTVALEEPAGRRPSRRHDPARGIGDRRGLGRDRHPLRVVARRHRVGRDRDRDSPSLQRCLGHDAGRRRDVPPARGCPRPRRELDLLRGGRGHGRRRAASVRQTGGRRAGAGARARDSLRDPSLRETRLGHASLWQLERLLEQRGAGHERRDELEALLYTLRPYARPDGTIPERFLPLLRDAFGDLL